MSEKTEVDGALDGNEREPVIYILQINLRAWRGEGYGMSTRERARYTRT